MLMYVIYDHPRDYPEHFVVRAWSVGFGAVLPLGDPMLTKTLDAARGHVPWHATNIGRERYDDPVIVEVWM